MARLKVKCKNQSVKTLGKNTEMNNKLSSNEKVLSQHKNEKITKERNDIKLCIKHLQNKNFKIMDKGE